jgi:hypothetical protein
VSLAGGGPCDNRAYVPATFIVSGASLVLSHVLWCGKAAFDQDQSTPSLDLINRPARPSGLRGLLLEYVSSPSAENRVLFKARP